MPQQQARQSEVRTQVRLPLQLHLWLRETCRDQHRSMNGQIVEILNSAKSQTEKAEAGQ